MWIFNYLLFMIWEETRKGKSLGIREILKQIRNSDYLQRTIDFMNTNIRCLIEIISIEIPNITLRIKRWWGNKDLKRTDLYLAELISEMADSLEHQLRKKNGAMKIDESFLKRARSGRLGIMEKVHGVSTEYDEDSALIGKLRDVSEWFYGYLELSKNSEFLTEERKHELGKRYSKALATFVAIHSKIGEIENHKTT